jgi:hypothetical protein
LEIDQEKRHSLNDDRRTRAHAGDSLREDPSGAGENGSYRNVTHVQSDAHPEKSLETRRAGHITELGASPANPCNPADSKPPRCHLNREVLEQRRLKPARRDYREGCRAAEDGETRPEQESEQVLLLGAKERIGPHGCDASRKRLRVEVWISASR